MKKIFMSFVLLLISLLFVGCDIKKEEEVTVLVPNGIPYVSIIGLKENPYKMDVVMGSDIIVSELVKNEYDVIVSPVVSALKLFSTGSSKYKMVDILTTDNLYIVSRENFLEDLSVLQNQEIVAFGQGATPGVVLSAFLNQKNISMSVSYESSMQAVISRFIPNTSSPNETTEATPKYVLLSEPNLSQIQLKFGITVYSLSLSEALETTIAQAGVFVSPNMSEEKIQALQKDLKRNHEELISNTEDYLTHAISLDASLNSIGYNVWLSSKNAFTGFYSTNLKEKTDPLIQIIQTYNPNFFQNIEINEDIYYEK